MLPLLLLDADEQEEGSRGVNDHGNAMGTKVYKGSFQLKGKILVLKVLNPGEGGGFKSQST